MSNLFNAIRKDLRFQAYSIFYTFYPKLCLACNYKAPPIDEWVCLSCKLKLPETNFHLDKENEFVERFWGKVKIESGASLYFFKKGNRTQNIIHSLKYKGRYQIGVILGRIYGRKLKKAAHFEGIDCIVPVPLHWKKLRKRGYNQSLAFAEGLSESMELPVISNGLMRIENSKSQTRKSRIDRLENVETVFQVKKPTSLAGKHLLLVDDVLTTGATLEACAKAILKISNTKVSIATIAMAVN